MELTLSAASRAATDDLNRRIRAFVARTSRMHSQYRRRRRTPRR